MTTWSKTPPTEPGWYWIQHRASEAEALTAELPVPEAQEIAATVEGVKP